MLEMNFPISTCPGTRQNSKKRPTDPSPGTVPCSGQCGALSTWGYTTLVSTSHFMAKLRLIILPSPLKTVSVFSSWKQKEADLEHKELLLAWRRQRPGEARASRRKSVAPQLTASSKQDLNQQPPTNCVLPTPASLKRSCPGLCKSPIPLTPWGQS